MTELHQAAIAYAKRGTAVFPLQPRGKEPATASGVKQATTDTAAIDGWWTAGPDLNIGIATGSRSGVWVLDIDDETGEQSLRELECANGELPETVEAITGKGRHCYFRLGDGDPIRNSAGKLGPGLDVRGDEGYVVAPPSIHPSGRQYEWSVDCATEFADAPQWLLDLVMKKSAPANGAPTSLHVGDAAPYVEAALENERAAVIKAPNGQRNDALNRAAFSLGQLVGSGLLDRARVEAALYSASVANGLVADDGEEATKNALRRAFRSGDYDIVHYAGHTMFDREHRARSGIYCHGGSVLSGADLAGLSRLPALVFFNACESALVRKAAFDAPDPDAKASGQIDKSVGLAESFLRGGVANFIGTYWKVQDKSADAFSEVFYEKLVSGAPIGDALLAGRRRVFENKHCDWADYLHYGNPGFVLKGLDDG